jgi:hypothetical protein
VRAFKVTADAADRCGGPRGRGNHQDPPIGGYALRRPILLAESAPVRLWYLPMPVRPGRHRLGPMTEMHSTLDRLEARIDYQAARIDALYLLLENLGVLTADTEEAVLFEDAPLARDEHAEPPRRSIRRLRVGEATGV